LGDTNAVADVASEDQRLSTAAHDPLGRHSVAELLGGADEAGQREAEGAYSGGLELDLRVDRQRHEGAASAASVGMLDVMRTRSLAALGMIFGSGVNPSVPACGTGSLREAQEPNLAVLARKEALG